MENPSSLLVSSVHSVSRSAGGRSEHQEESLEMLPIDDKVLWAKYSYNSSVTQAKVVHVEGLSQWINFPPDLSSEIVMKPLENSLAIWKSSLNSCES